CLGKKVGPAADIYSLGIVLYEMATQTVPFVGESPLAVLDGHVRQEPDRPSGRNSVLPIEWDEAIFRAIQKKPDDRFHSAEKMAEALRGLDGVPLRAPSGLQRVASSARLKAATGSMPVSSHTLSS